jgi:hypothetical protein
MGALRGPFFIAALAGPLDEVLHFRNSNQIRLGLFPNLSI